MFIPTGPGYNSTPIPFVYLKEKSSPIPNYGQITGVKRLPIRLLSLTISRDPVSIRPLSSVVHNAKTFIGGHTTRRHYGLNEVSLRGSGKQTPRNRLPDLFRPCVRLGVYREPQTPVFSPKTTTRHRREGSGRVTGLLYLAIDTWVGETPSPTRPVTRTRGRRTAELQDQWVANP